MAFVVGSRSTPAHICSTEWVATLLKAELEALQEEEVDVREIPEIKLTVDFGGMITSKIPKAFVDHEDGEFSFYVHQRTGIRELFQKAVADVGRDEFVKIRSQNHILCVTPDHALQILFYLDNELIIAMEEDAKNACQEALDVLREDARVEISAQHQLNVN